MAEKRSTTSAYEGIMKDLKAGKFAPVYLLMGEESYYIDKVADYVAENAIAEEERDFCQTVVYGLDTTPAQVMDMARMAPMMAKYQVVIVKEAQNLKGIEQLEKYFSHPVPTTILVVCYKKEAPKSRKGWIGEAEKNGVFLESRKMYESELPSFVKTYLKVRGVDIEEKAVAMMVEHIGSDLSRMASELDKLFLSFPEKNTRIAAEYVEEKIGISKDFNNLELRKAIVNKDVLKANLIVKYFDKNPKAGNLHTLVPMLFNLFQNLMCAYYCPQRQNENDLAAWLELRSGWAAREYITMMRGYSAMKTMQIIQMLRIMAAKSNGLDNRSASDGQLMKELIYFILH